MADTRDSNLHTHGRFVWHDLVSYDQKKAVDFYAQLVGWKTHGDDQYVHFDNAGVPHAGSPKREKDPHTPPHWLAYVTVDDVAATVERVKKLGGQVFVEPMTIPKVGTFAVIADPTGGVLAPFRQSNGESPESDERPAAGTFVWNELHSTDPAKAAAFYGEVFGWTFDAVDMGPMGTYHLAKRGERQTAGIMKSMAPGQSYWLNYIGVNDVDAKTKEAAALGAKVVAPPMDIPNVGRASVMQDPTGVHFALFQGK